MGQGDPVGQHHAIARPIWSRLISARLVPRIPPPCRRAERRDPFILKMVSVSRISRTVPVNSGSLGKVSSELGHEECGQSVARSRYQLSQIFRHLNPPARGRRGAGGVLRRAAGSDSSHGRDNISAAQRLVLPEAPRDYRHSFRNLVHGGVFRCGLRPSYFVALNRKEVRLAQRRLGPAAA
jgi:hypothetical protein